MAKEDNKKPRDDSDLGRHRSTLLVMDLCPSQGSSGELSAEKKAQLSEWNTAFTRGLLGRYDGRLVQDGVPSEILFEKPECAVGFALEYHLAVLDFSQDLDIPIAARAGLHEGEVDEHPTQAQRLIASRLMSAAHFGQILLSKPVFDRIDRQGNQDDFPPGTVWLDYGAYEIKDVEEPMGILEVGISDTSPLAAPADSDQVRKISSAPLTSGENIAQVQPDRDPSGRKGGDAPLPFPDQATTDLTSDFEGDEDIVVYGRYRVIREIGRGGFGCVYLAENPLLPGRLFAVKVLSWTEGGKALDNLLADELSHLLDLPHQNIVQVRTFDTEVIDGVEEAYIVMDFIQGPTGTSYNLKQHLSASGKRLPPSEVKMLFHQIMSALSFVHERRIAHLDLKPQNILLDADLNAFVSDFGISKNVGDETTQNTMVTIAAASQNYASPEQMDAHAGSRRSDIYSIGVMIYECLVGTRPKVKYDPPSRFDLDPAWDDLVGKCLEPEKENRYPNSRELLRALEAIPESDGIPVQHTPPAPPAQSRTKLFAGIAVGAVSVLMIFFFFSIRRGGEIPKAADPPSSPTAKVPAGAKDNPERASVIIPSMTDETSDPAIFALAEPTSTPTASPETVPPTLTPEPIPTAKTSKPTSFGDPPPWIKRPNPAGQQTED